MKIVGNMTAQQEKSLRVEEKSFQWEKNVHLKTKL